MERAEAIAVTSTVNPLQMAEQLDCAPIKPSLAGLTEVNCQPALPFSESLYSCLLNQEKPCICNGLGVECQHEIQAKASSVVRATDEADYPNVVAHVEAQSTSIVPQSRWRNQEGTMEARELKGLQLAALANIIQKGDTWIVPS
jgi:hypothetical protein